LLRQTRQPLALIAQETGFAHHLTQIFRREMGVTPGRFRAALTRVFAGLGRATGNDGRDFSGGCGPEDYCGRREDDRAGCDFAKVASHKCCNHGRLPKEIVDYFASMVLRFWFAVCRPQSTAPV
jgi:hypothetical protein